jgi:dTMP kinase
MNNAQLIVIEGADGSGKATQAHLLKEHFENEGVAVALFAFPRYEWGRSGQLLGELLRGDHGDFMSISPYISSLPYVIDRVAARDELQAALDSGKMVVCDRYLPSNLAHQSAKIRSTEEQKKFIEFCEELEYENLRMPRPSAVIYLSVPTAVSTKLVEGKGARGWLKGMRGKKDLAERDISHQKKARAMYEQFAKDRPTWFLIECVNAGDMRTRESIHDEIWGIVEKQLPQ